MPNVLIVDDEDRFRTSLARRLKMRGYDTLDVDNGEDGIKLIRSRNDVDVVILDRKMPKLVGEQTLKEMKTFRPELQVIMLTGHGSMESAMESGRLEAYAYLQKPYRVEELIEVIDAARQDRITLMQRHEISQVEKDSAWRWLVGSHNSRPGVALLGLLIFLAVMMAPTPERLLELVSSEKTGRLSDPHVGYADYMNMQTGESIATYYGRSYRLGKTAFDEHGRKVTERLTPEHAAWKAKVMLGVLLVAALFWATGAIPVGVTAMLVGALMYFTRILPPDGIAKAYAKDAVFFIFGVLAMARAISQTGLDRRIGLLLLNPAKSLTRLLFIFLPLFGMACSFVSEHALIAFIMPLIMVVYASSIRAAGIAKDRTLAVMLVLSLCFAANSGGPGSPAAGGRNAVMLGILADYGAVPSFGQWVAYGLPFVPVMGLVIATYFFLVFRKKLAVKKLDVSAIVREASSRIGPMNRSEYLTAAVLLFLVVLWVTCSDIYGMGGPVILCLVILNVLRILRWQDIARIPWDVVALYASACALGKGLATTGAALYLADGFVGMLPEFLRSGEGLAMASSLFTGIVTNLMSDGAAVSAIGPITIPMATISGTHPWMIGLATAFSSSFAHMLIIGTPNNAIAYAMAKDPATGEQLVTLGDFLRHGAAIFVLSLAVLWVWTFWGYWRLVGF